MKIVLNTQLYWSNDCVNEWNCYSIDKSIFHLTCDSHLILFFPASIFFSLLSTLCMKFYSRNPISRITFFLLQEFFSVLCFPCFFLLLAVSNWLEILYGLWAELASSEMSAKNVKNEKKIFRLKYTIQYRVHNTLFWQQKYNIVFDTLCCMKGKRVSK